MSKMNDLSLDAQYPNEEEYYESKSSSQEFYINDQEWAVDLERSYDEYVMGLDIFLAPEEELDTDLPDTISGQPFCGCNNCYSREQLFFLVPRIIRGYKEGKVTLAEDEE
jgi:hypothetical protein